MSFKTNVHINLEYGDYVLKTATSLPELWEAFKLRYECFVEPLEKNVLKLGVDIDEYDYRCDHLLIIEKSTKRVCGTYRLRSSRFVDNFYSDSEFFLKNFYNTQGNKVELGRACIHKDFRNGATISLIWKGLSEYMRLTNSRYMFGCSSVFTTDSAEVSALIQYLKDKGHHSANYKVDTTLNFHIDIKENLELSEEQVQMAKSKLPGLINTYLMAGAKVYGYPAYDRDFECIDLLTILDLEDVRSSYKRRYFAWYP